MSKYYVFLFLYFPTGWTFEVNVNGVATPRTQFCIGESLTFVCRLPAMSFLWTSPPYVDNIAGVVSQQFPMARVGDFTARYQGPQHSTLDVIAFQGLNGTTITCQDATQNTQQRASITVKIKCTWLYSDISVNTKYKNSFNRFLANLLN